VQRALWYVAHLSPSIQGFNVFQNDVLAGLGAKQPKAVAGCVLTLKELVRCVLVHRNMRPLP